MPTSNERVQDELIQYGVRLDRFNEDTFERVDFVLTELQDELRGLTAEADLPEVRESQQAKRTVDLLEQVNATIDPAYLGIDKFHKIDLRELASIANLQAARAINIGLTVRLAKPTLTPGELTVLSQDPIIRGRPSSSWWAGQSTNLQNRYAQELRLGLAQGETNDQLVRRIIGKPTGKIKTVVNPKTGKKKRVAELKGGIMETSRREAKSLVRTSAQTVSNDVLMDSYRANAKILRGVAALVTLDSRTTPICMSRSGGIWNVETGEPLPESTRQEPMPPPPPWHWNALAAGSLIETLDGQRSIESIVPGDMVMTGSGRFRPCYAVHRKLHEGSIIDIAFDSGTKLSITGDHPVAVAGLGWVAAGNMQIGHECFERAQDGTATVHGLPACYIAERSPALLAGELISDEVLSLPIFIDIAVDLQGDPPGEDEVKHVTHEVELKQVVGISDSIHYPDKVQFATCWTSSQPAGAFVHVGVLSDSCVHGVVSDHTFGHAGESGVSILGLAVGPDLGGVVYSPAVGLDGALPLATCADVLTQAVSGDASVCQVHRPLDGAQRFTAVDVAAVDQLKKQSVTVPGLLFRHAKCISIVEREYQGYVYNLSVIGDETYVADGVIVHNCRSLFMPVTKSWDELRASRGQDKLPAADKRKLDTVPRKERASIDGKVPGNLNFEQWLNTKDKKFQVDQLGPARWKLWDDGKINLSQLTDFSGRTLTITELRAAAE